MHIGNIDLNSKILLIAEVGNNHEGSYTLAEEMIGLAAKAGADAVKFQTIVPERLVSPNDAKRIQQLKRFQLSYEQFEKLAKVAEQTGIMFLATPFDIDSARFLAPLVPAFKIASGDNNFYPLIKVIAQTAKPIILSAGMTNLNGVLRAKTCIETVWAEQKIQQQLAVLHCVASYPTEPKDANLLNIKTLKKLGVTVGYSDHTMGIEAAVLSVVLGARIIEKHFTLAKDHSDFQDHRLSADPEEFEELVRQVRTAEQMLGDGNKRILDVEQPLLTGARRSIVAARDLKAGEKIVLEDLDWIRPGGGLKPGEEVKLIGQNINRAVTCGQMILPEYVEQ